MASIGSTVNTHFFNIADSYLAFHAKAEPEMQAILDTLNSVPEAKRDQNWCDDVDYITDIYDNARNFTVAVQKMIAAKAAKSGE